MSLRNRRARRAYKRKMNHYLGSIRELKRLRSDEETQRAAPFKWWARIIDQEARVQQESAELGTLARRLGIS
jgi:hypothetical protein